MELIIGKSAIKSSFSDKWSRFVPAILLYGESGKKTKRFKLNDVDEAGVLNEICLYHNYVCFHLDFADETAKQIAALKILSECLAVKKSTRY